MQNLDELKEERREILAGWEYAFAMGHGCTIGSRDPRLQSVLARLDVVNALISEMEG